MFGQRIHLRTATASALLALLLMAGTASAHGADDVGVFQRYDELFAVGAVAFVLTLAVGATVLFGPLGRRAPRRTVRPRSRAGMPSRLR